MREALMPVEDEGPGPSGCFRAGARSGLRVPRALWFVLVLAFLARVAAVVALNTLPFQGEVFAADSRFYLGIARSLDGSEPPPAKTTNPGQILFARYLAMVLTLSGSWDDPMGRGTVAVGLANALLGTGAVLCVYGTARQVFGARAAAASGVAAALTPYSLFWTPYVLREPLGSLFVAFAMLVTTWGLSRPSVGRALATAAATSILLIYPYFVAIPMVGLCVGFTGWALIGDKRQARPWTLAALVGIVAVFVLAPPSSGPGRARTQVTWLLVQQLYEGFGPGQVAETDGYWEGNTTIPAARFAGVPKREFETGISREQQTAIMATTLAAHVVSRPLEAVSLIPAKLYNMWRPTFAGASARNQWLLGGGYVVTMVLAVAGIVSTRWRDQRVILIGLIILGFVVLHVYTYGMIRFREYPMQPLLVFSGPGLIALMAGPRSWWQRAGFRVRGLKMRHVQ